MDTEPRIGWLVKLETSIAAARSTRSFIESMMPQSGHAKCDICNFDVEVLEGWDRVEGLYETEGRGLVPVRARWIWCQNCGVSQSEDLPPRSEIEKELWRTRWNFTGWGISDWQFTRQVTGTDSPVRKIHRKILCGYFYLLAKRQSPPRCLTCGSIDFCEFEGDLIGDGMVTITHTGCAGTIRLELGSIWTGILESYPAYNVNGLRIGSFTQHQRRWTLKRTTEESTHNPLNPRGG